ncbi:hypothetical protein WJX73_009652 [Symbiochloris irregularis]|uniref:Uncharacterized protein n=1 Tax=Symbiochloris irregularis TaxID=706552 RepID=A0AAW1P443_9CHLO
MEDEADSCVLSDVHMEACPPLQQGSTWTTTFTLPEAYQAPSQCTSEAAVDEDGDLVIDRQSDRSQLTIHHSLKTPLRDVGLQVWRGALPLADYILGNADLFRGCMALELGCGSGLAGIVMAMLAERVFLTDIGEAVLGNCQRNVDANSHHFQAGSQTALVRQMDWLHPECLQSSAAETPGPFGWSPEDKDQLRTLDVILAADTVYDDDLTDAMFKCATLLLSGAQRHMRHQWQGMYIALEKRYNFTVDSMNVVAPAYEKFKQYFLTGGGRGKFDNSQLRDKLGCSQTIALHGAQIDTNCYSIAQ